ncbi:MAG: O-antigen ligase family protein [Bacteroidetes bacterium]|nr:O-antigen ligase family protein [Bacteroidota bacterium]
MPGQLLSVTTKRQQYAFAIYLTGLVLLAISLPLSKWLMSVSQFVIAGSWLIYGTYFSRLKGLFLNKLFMVFASVYLLHLLGMLWTTDVDYGLNDLRIKLPLLFFPFMLMSMPLPEKKHFRWVLLAFVGAVFASTMVSLFVYLGWWKAVVRDSRDISIFISHIRLSLMVVLAIFILLHYLHDFSKIIIAIAVAAIAWFIYFLFLLNSFTGIVILIACGIYFISKKIFTRAHLPYAIGLSACFIAATCWFFIYVKNIIANENNCVEQQLFETKLTTASGASYTFNDRLNGCENGFKCGNYICEPELQQEWNKRSQYNYDSLDNKKNYIRFTLIRYLTSKGLKKDSAALASLDVSDIEAIESSITNYKLKKVSPFVLRLHQTAYEYKNALISNNLNGSSVMMRFIYWKASIQIWKEKFLTGHGTGDNKLVFNKWYTAHPVLEEKWQLRSHNQYLAIAVSFGLIGLAIFFFGILYPVYAARAYLAWLFNIFLITALMSFINEDTLETQAGVTFFVFFYSLFMLLFRKSEKKD